MQELEFSRKIQKSLKYFYRFSENNPVFDQKSMSTLSNGDIITKVYESSCWC